MFRPRPWSTADRSADGSDSFARRTLAVRVPRILETTLAQNRELFPSYVKAACRALHAEITAGRLRALEEDAPDRAAWDEATAPHVGKTWLEIPWYFAESYFYRRVLEATGWFQERRGLDPYLLVKEDEERHMLAQVEAARAALPKDPDARLRRLLHAALWGNRADLSYDVGRRFGAQGGLDDLLADDTIQAHRLLADATRVAIFLDNAGTELAFDLLLVHELVARGVSVAVFAKSQPFFVSDAMPVDVKRTADLLGLDVPTTWTHPYLVSSGFFFVEDMPDDLRRLLAGFSAVVLKGDANYRRTVGDAPWDPTTPLREASAFPAPFLALRVLKAEVVAGLNAEVVARVRELDVDWQVNGRFGVLQVGAAQAEQP